MDPEHLPKAEDPHLASVRPKAKLLSRILITIDDSDRPLLEMDLLHAICARYPRVNFPRFPELSWSNYVSVSCVCDQTHQVSGWGFLLLEEVYLTLDSRKQSVLDIVTRNHELTGPLLTALSSKLLRQQDLAKNLSIWAVGCDTEAEAEAFATLVEHCQKEGLEVWCEPLIFVYGEIGAEGWAAIRRAVEHLPDPWKNITLRCNREVMVAGRREDLKAIWTIIND